MAPSRGTHHHDRPPSDARGNRSAVRSRLVVPRQGGHRGLPDLRGPGHPSGCSLRRGPGHGSRGEGGLAGIRLGAGCHRFAGLAGRRRLVGLVLRLPAGRDGLDARQAQAPHPSGRRRYRRASGWRQGVGRWLVPSLVNQVVGVFFIVDYLWPLWDSKDQRLTDKIFGTRVVVAGSRTDEAWSPPNPIS